MSPYKPSPGWMLQTPSCPQTSGPTEKNTFLLYLIILSMQKITLPFTSPFPFSLLKRAADLSFCTFLFTGYQKHTRCNAGQMPDSLSAVMYACRAFWKLQRRLASAVHVFMTCLSSRLEEKLTYFTGEAKAKHTINPLTHQYKTTLKRWSSANRQNSLFWALMEVS